MIRQAKTEDLDRMLAIFQIARDFMRESGNPNQWKDNRPSVKSIQEDIMRGDSYVMERNQSIVATFTLQKTPDPCYAYIIGAWKNDEEYGTIHKVASDGTCRGIFEELLAFASKKFDNLRIDTHRDNKLMQHLIEKNGFEYCGIVFVDDGTERLAYQRIIEKEQSNMEARIILASGSPRRKELLELIGVKFEVMVSDKETKISDVSPEVGCVQQAGLKGRDIVEMVKRKYPDEAILVIGADSIVVLNGEILCKPEDESDAYRMIEKMQGKSHEVMTGVYVYDGRSKKEYEFLEKTTVHLAPMDDAQIRDYLSKGEYIGKAGSYAIQGDFAKNVIGIEGDFYNVMGLPIGRLYREYLRVWLS